MGKIVKLVERNDNGKSWTPTDMLRDFLEKTPSPQFKKAIVFFLAYEDGEYSTVFGQAGLNRPEIVALLEVMKLKFTRKLAGDEDR